MCLIKYHGWFLPKQDGGDSQTKETDHVERTRPRFERVFVDDTVRRDEHELAERLDDSDDGKYATLNSMIKYG